MKATFFQRLGAYLIDAILVSIIVGLFSPITQNSEKYEEITTKSEQLIQNYMNNDINIEKYQIEYQEISYELDKINYKNNIISLVIAISYYIIFCYLNHGQTIGKRLLKIRIKSQTGLLTAKQIVIRALIINSIASTIMLLLFINFVSKNNYFVLKNVLTILETIFVFASAILILYRKDKRALQDIITKTEVILEKK